MALKVSSQNNKDGGRAMLGPKLKELRKRANLSVAELSLRSGVSVGMISQTERSQSNPSLKILDKLAQALNVSVSDVLDSASPEKHKKPGKPSRGTTQMADGAPFVRRYLARPKFDVGPLPLSKEMLSPHDTRNLQFMLINFPPFARSDDVMILPGEKAGLVLRGTFRLSVDHVEAVLSEGDSFQFDSSRPHWIRNEQGEISTLLWIMARSPPMHQI